MIVSAAFVGARAPQPQQLQHWLSALLRQRHHHTAKQHAKSAKITITTIMISAVASPEGGEEALGVTGDTEVTAALVKPAVTREAVSTAGKEEEDSAVEMPATPAELVT